MKTCNFNIQFKFILLALLGLLSGCSEFTEVGLPSSQLTAEAVFSNKNTANAAMTNIYSKIRETGLLTGYSSGLCYQLGLYTDELQYYGIAGTSQANFYNNTLLRTDPALTELWISSYNQIYAANAIIEGVNASKSLATVDKNQLLGEAAFVRALIHFYLVDLFGPIPFITTTDYKINSTATRMPETKVYEQIKKDLELAADLLPNVYIGSDRVRPNKFAAKALLARVCLYMELWDQAANASSAVLNQTDLYTWPVSLDFIFEKQSPSTIWQLMPAVSGSNAYQGNVFIFIQGPPVSVVVSGELINAFNAEDLRKKQWLKAVSNSTTTWYHAYKYKKQSNTASSVEYSIVLRLAEQYLIRAESRAHTGDLIGAKEDLNKTRNLAGLDNTSAVSSDEILQAVMRERRLEFFTEYGHRFFDLKRTGTLEQELSAVKPQWKKTNRLFPLPESELILNPNLNPQNEGY